MVGSWLWYIALALAAGTSGVGIRFRAPTVGIGTHTIDPPSVAQLRDLGVRQVRWTLYWDLWNDSLYRRDWAAGLERGQRAGLDIVVVVHRPRFGDFEQRQALYRAFAQFMRDMAARFPRVRAWQLWNEMDVTFTDAFGAGHPEVPLRQRGHFYAEMLRLAYPAVKQGNPQALVVTGGIASDLEGGFLEGLYDAKADFDVLALHTYGFPLVDAFRARGLAARRIMRAHHDERPLWNTEFGLEDRVIPGNSELSPEQVDAAHREAWRTTIETNAREKIYERIYGYVLGDGKSLGFALVRPDGSPRPAYLWLKGWIEQRRVSSTR